MYQFNDDDADDDDIINDEHVTAVLIVLCGLSTASTCTCRHNAGYTQWRSVYLNVTVNFTSDRRRICSEELGAFY